MTEHDELADALNPVLQVFAELGITYRIGGSVASSVYGRARSTMDVDLVVDLAPSHVRPLCDALHHAYYLDEQAVREAIGNRGAFNLIHLATMIKVDLFVLDQGPFDRASFQRCRSESIGTLKNVAFCTAEDMVLRKLEWYRAGGQISERQWSDVLGLLQVQADKLDRDYLVRWARELDLLTLLERAEKEAQA